MASTKRVVIGSLASGGSDKTVDSDEPGRRDSPRGTRKSAARDEPDKKSTRGSADGDTRGSADRDTRGSADRDKTDLLAGTSKDPPAATSKDPPAATSKEPPAATSKDPPAATSKEPPAATSKDPSPAPPTAPPAPAGGSTRSIGTMSSTRSMSITSSWSFLAGYVGWVGAGLGLALVGGLIYLLCFSGKGGGQKQKGVGKDGNTIPDNGNGLATGPKARADPRPLPRPRPRLNGTCDANNLCLQGRCLDGTCQWVGKGEVCTETFHCESGLCQDDPDERQRTCRVKLNDECNKAKDYLCPEQTVCSDAVTPPLCKAVIGGQCSQGDDCYQKLYELTGAAWTDTVGNFVGNTHHHVAAWWNGESAEETAKRKNAANVRTEEPDGKNHFPMTWCHAPTKTCQVFAAHGLISAADATFGMCHLSGKQIVEVAEDPKNNLCKATKDQPCGDPRNRPMHSWCDSGECIVSSETKDKNFKEQNYICKAGGNAATAQIQLEERSDAWLLNNASRSKTEAYAGKASNLRGKRTRSSDASALQLDAP